MNEQYTVFLVNGAFVDAYDGVTDCLRIDHVSRERLPMLLDLASQNQFDMVVRSEAPNNA